MHDFTSGWTDLADMKGLAGGAAVVVLWVLTMAVDMAQKGIHLELGTLTLHGPVTQQAGILLGMAVAVGMALAADYQVRSRPDRA